MHLQLRLQLYLQLQLQSHAPLVAGPLPLGRMRQVLRDDDGDGGE
jgi:hypothetical protein